MKHYDIRVTGKVQGVLFRTTARDMAFRLGISGLARNEPDGSVYIEAEGLDNDLDDFVKWCREGPPRARVEGVEVAEGKIKGFAAFGVR